MALTLQTLITAARDRNPAFEQRRVPHAVLARFLTAYQRELLSRAVARNRSFLTQQASVVFDIAAANAVGTAGAGTPGGVPASVSSGGVVSAVQAPVGTAAEVDTDDVVVLVSERTVNSATSTTLVRTGAGWTANAYTNKTVVITAGRGAGQRRTINSNTTDTLTVSQAWTTTPDTTSLFKVVSEVNEATLEMGVVASSPFTAERLGYLVKVNAAGVAYLDLSAPLVAKYDAGITLPAHHYIVGGTVRFTEAGDEVPLTLVDYSARFNPRAEYAAYIQNGELFLCGDGDDWTDVVSIDLRYVPVPPALTALTDTLLLPDNAYGALVSGAAAEAAQRVSGMPDVPEIDVRGFNQVKAEAEGQWLREIAVQKRNRTTVIREW